MLKKLMKHEYKATVRFFVPVYLIFAGLLTVQRLSMLTVDKMNGRDDFIGKLAGIIMGLFTAAAVFFLVAMVACPILYGLIRFWKNVLGDEGYLTHTLPVSTGNIILSRVLVTVTWAVATTLVAVAGGLLYFLSIDAGGVKDFFDALDLIWLFAKEADVTGWVILVIALVLISLITQLFANLLAFYTSMSIGQTANSHKLLISVGVAIAINMALSFAAQALIAGGAMLFGQDFITYLNHVLVTPLGNLQMMSAVFGIAIILNLLLATAYFFVTRYFLSRRLNLA